MVPIQRNQEKLNDLRPNIRLSFLLSRFEHSALCVHVTLSLHTAALEWYESILEWRNISHGPVMKDSREICWISLPVPSIRHVIWAEALFTEFSIEHNLPLSVSDHELSCVAKCYQIRQLQRSTGERIMNTLATADTKQLALAIKTGRFSKCHWW